MRLAEHITQNIKINDCAARSSLRNDLSNRILASARWAVQYHEVHPVIISVNH